MCTKDKVIQLFVYQTVNVKYSVQKTRSFNNLPIKSRVILKTNCTNVSLILLCLLVHFLLVFYDVCLEHVFSARVTSKG